MGLDLFGHGAAGVEPSPELARHPNAPKTVPHSPRNFPGAIPEPPKTGPLSSRGRPENHPRTDPEPTGHRPRKMGRTCLLRS